MRLLDELERLAGLGLPEWSVELTDQTDPVIAELSAAINRDRAVRDEVIAYLSQCDDPIVSDWLRLQLDADFSLEEPDDEMPELVVDACGLMIPASPAIYLAEDTISAAVKEVRGLHLPWERTLGCWFFGKPQASTVLTEWPTGSDGSALDFLCQIDLRKVDKEVPGFDLTGLPRKVCLQIYVDLDAGPGPIDHRVVALSRAQRKKHLMEPPPGSGVNDAWPILINPVGALTIPRADSPELSLDPADERFYEAICRAADEAAYDYNLFTTHPRHRPAVTEPDYLPYVPMARMGGFIPADPAEWQKPAEEALGCDASEMFLLYDGPVDPEPKPVGDPERLRIAILIERSRLDARDFTHTYAFSY